MGNEVNNMQDVIDSRDVIARIEELEAAREGHIESEGSHSWVLTEEATELNALESLAEEAAITPPTGNTAKPSSATPTSLSMHRTSPKRSVTSTNKAGPTPASIGIKWLASYKWTTPLLTSTVLLTEFAREGTTMDDPQYHGETLVTFTPETLAEFKKAYARAVEVNAGTFTFNGQGYVPGYAKYLIEYLEGQFNG